MKQFIGSTNHIAAGLALTALYGLKAEETFHEVYDAIDEAMRLAWSAATAEATAAHKSSEADKASEDEAQMEFLFAEADMAGFKRGYQQCEEEFRESANRANEAYDDGYVDGVGDARARPERADEYLSELAFMDAEDALEEAYLEACEADDAWHAANADQTL